MEAWHEESFYKKVIFWRALMGEVVLGLKRLNYAALYLSDYLTTFS